MPLSQQALALLPARRELSGHTDRMFPGSGTGRADVISENTINNLFRRIGYKDKQQSPRFTRVGAKFVERTWLAGRSLGAPA